MWLPLLERRPLDLAGRRLTLFLYQTLHREKGRRVVVGDRDGNVVFDTLDCYDLGNAEDRLNDWLADQLAAVPEPQPQEAA